MVNAIPTIGQITSTNAPLYASNGILGQAQYPSAPAANTAVHAAPTGTADASQPGDATTTAGITGTTSTAPAYNQATVDGFNQAIGTDQSALDRLGTQLGIAQGNINGQYTQQNNTLASSLAQANNSYNTSTDQNQQSLRTNKNQIADQASTGLTGLLRTLGAFGAGGSSEAQFVAPQAVAGQASQQRAGAGQTYAQNQSGLDTNWNNYQTQDKNQHAQLNDWQTQQLNSAQAQSDTNKQNLLSQLANLVGQKSAAMGGSYTASAQPYIDQANAMSGTIDQLGKLNPTYTGTTPVYNAPSLSSYTVNANGAPTTQTNALDSTTSPYLSLLLGNQKDKTTLGAQ